jgi:DNA-directed RNA polymerase subunit RPC12/RpoP
MAVLVDYRCGACRRIEERSVESPPPSEVRCPWCGSASRRKWAPVGLVGRAAQPMAGPRAPAAAPLCQANRDIPGLCALSPTAARSLVARVRGDNRALEAEIAYQERMQKESPGTLTVGGHGHAHGPGDDTAHHDNRAKTTGAET